MCRPASATAGTRLVAGREIEWLTLVAIVSRNSRELWGERAALASEFISSGGDDSQWRKFGVAQDVREQFRTGTDHRLLAFDDARTFAPLDARSTVIVRSRWRARTVSSQIEAAMCP
jgi:hypothetical protein